MPVWVPLLLISAAFIWVAATLLSKVNPDERLPLTGRPDVVPTAFIFILGGGVAFGWLAASFASESVLGPRGYLVGALGIFVPWVAVRIQHNRRLG